MADKLIHYEEFWWCSEGRHDECEFQIKYTECTCECHLEKEMNEDKKSVGLIYGYPEHNNQVSDKQLKHLVKLASRTFGERIYLGKIIGEVPKTDEEVIKRCIYLHGGTVVDALIDQ